MRPARWSAHAILFVFFFFNDTATTEIYTLSLHALFRSRPDDAIGDVGAGQGLHPAVDCGGPLDRKSTTSELQSQSNLVCRLLLEKKKIRCSLPASRSARYYSQYRLSQARRA